MNGSSRLASGDLIADRRYAIARAFELRGDLVAAADLCVQAIERAPSFAAAWFALGRIRERGGDSRGALEAFRQVLATDREDRQGAALRIARLEGRTEPMPPAYVRSLFDGYAGRYDHALLTELEYCGPRLLRDAVAAAQHARKRPLRFRRILDLGCGTGLAGEAFRSCGEAIVGVDVSAAMVEQSRRKALYAGLVLADMVEALDRESNRADLVLAADAVPYLADLDPLCRGVHRVLEPAGLFAFTAETHPGGGVVLGEKLRFAHSARYVRDALEGAGLKVFTLAEAAVRSENRTSVAGIVGVAERM